MQEGRIADSMSSGEASSSSIKDKEDAIEQVGPFDADLQGTEDEREAKALLGWVQAVDGASEEGVLSRHVLNIGDLCDGVAFFDVLGAV